MTRLLSRKRVATRLDVSEKTVRRWVQDGEFPPASVVLPGGHERWTLIAVERWIAVKESASIAPPVKGKTARTNRDKAGQDGTNSG